MSTLDVDFLDLETSNESLLQDESTSSCVSSETSSTGSCLSVSEVETESESEGEAEMEIEGEQTTDEVLHLALYDEAKVTVIDAIIFMIQFLLR